MMASWFALGGALVTTAIGHLFFRLYFLRGRIWILALAILLFVVVPVLNYIALRHIAISMVYMSTALTQVMVLALARFVLHETLTRDHWIAAALITCGILVYAL